MHVIATAGHVDHGKSTLVDALTGMQSDRLAEERRRGLSIELGYVWTSLPGAGEVAFVDVPGHERFISTMLAGIGPVPAALLVVAADDPWMPQTEEHLSALDALGVRHGVVAVTRSDLADPAASAALARARLETTSLRGSPVVPVSARTGAGLDDLRALLVEMVGSLPVPDPAADVRLWVDRRFTVKGAGTVVTGTLARGRVAKGDELLHAGVPVRVRGVQSLGAPVSEAVGVARVALNVTGEGLDGLDRGSALETPGAWFRTTVLDVGLEGVDHALPTRVRLHVGAAAVEARVRPLGATFARLVLETALPLRVGDRALARDPGSRRLWGVRVLDPAPPPLRRRGAGSRRAAELAGLGPGPDVAGEVRRRRVVSRSLLARIGVPAPARVDDSVAAGEWLMSASHAARVAGEVSRLVREHDLRDPLDPGIPVVALADRLRLPSPDLVAAVVAPPLQVRGGRVLAGAAPAGLPPDVERAVCALEADLAVAPFVAPTADRLASLGLQSRGLAAATRAGRLLAVAPGIVLLPGADRQAASRLRGLPQPFSASEARISLGTTRRVVLPLLDLLDRSGLTRRLPDDRREVV